MVALVSGDAAKAASLAADFDAKHHYSYGEFEQCLDNPAVDAVYIATANGAHVQFALEAAAHGKHVLCEKPLATTVEDCMAIVDACRKNRVRLMTPTANILSQPVLHSSSCSIQASWGRLAPFTPHLRTICRRTRRGTPTLPWRGGGALMDLGIYCINTVRWLAEQEPLEAMGHTWKTDPRRFSNVEENIAFELTFPAGLHMQGSCSFTAAKASFLQIHCEKGWAALDPALCLQSGAEILWRSRRPLVREAIQGDR